MNTPEHSSKLALSPTTEGFHVFVYNRKWVLNLIVRCATYTAAKGKNRQILAINNTECAYLIPWLFVYCVDNIFRGFISGNTKEYILCTDYRDILYLLSNTRHGFKLKSRILGLQRPIFLLYRKTSCALEQKVHSIIKTFSCWYTWAQHVFYALYV